ncbi:P-loop NTPase fold protein [Mucilaginibacter celer]|uniref:KAP NTPase domain-containing protein n=1 Tax=Mucilaginibacter celer TaxID=2305508 RepID=A0A494VJP4_9SPHI|nr:P-loop NTPase fold protein [Mucilaginibacter celer]AYL95286.1 hypothetical protein HYN43_008250 [Mucilaginibacter celer]
MNKPEIQYIPTPTLTGLFDTHINESFNDRILFSGPFGAGKSTFIKNYFESREEFVVLKLYPVHYSIAGNQDVFELIKYDLIYELLRSYGKDVRLNSEQYSMLLISQMFWMHQLKLSTPLKLMLKAKEALSPGEPVSGTDILDDLGKIAGEFKDYRAAVSPDELKQLNHFVGTFKRKSGHIHESDEITDLITSMLERVVEAKSKTVMGKEVKSVLLIDDLDRLDPEHVFRLFNIFSAHYDELTDTNKFGFDKIIFVCDVNNVRQMFSHRYGISAEFNGYIDKFYSSGIFRFNMKQYLKDSLKNIFHDKQALREYSDGKLAKEFTEKYSLSSRDGFFDFMSYIFERLIDKNLIQIRNFQRFRYFTLPNKKITVDNNRTHIIYHPLLVFLCNAERFFASPADLEDALTVLSETYDANYTELSDTQKDESDTEAHYVIQYSLPFILPSKKIFGRHRYEKDKEFSEVLQNENGATIRVFFEVHRNFTFDYNYLSYNRMSMRNDMPDQASPANPNPFWFLLLAYRNVRKKELL